MPEKDPVPDEQTRLRARLLLNVLTGKMTSKEAAKTIGVSRKTWHEWQRRGLEAMLSGLSRRPTGRPAIKRDREKEELQKKSTELKARIVELERSILIQRAVNQLKKVPSAPGHRRNDNGQVSGDRES